MPTTITTYNDFSVFGLDRNLSYVFVVFSVLLLMGIVNRFYPNKKSKIPIIFTLISGLVLACFAFIEFNKYSFIENQEENIYRIIDNENKDRDIKYALLDQWAENAIGRDLSDPNLIVDMKIIPNEPIIGIGAYHLEYMSNFDISVKEVGSDGNEIVLIDCQYGGFIGNTRLEKEFNVDNMELKNYSSTVLCY